jgi:hypothetical protein
MAHLIAASLLNSDSDVESVHSGNSASHSGSETGSEISSGSDNTPSIDSTDGLSDKEEALRSYYNGVVSTIDKLFDASILIRGTSRNFRASRAATHVEKDAEGNNVIEQFKTIVALKIKWLCPETPDWLVERLTRVIAMRRQQFYYQKAHQKRVAKESTIYQDKDPVVPRKVKPSESTTTIQVETKTQKEMTTLDHESSTSRRTKETSTTSKTVETVASNIIPENERPNIQTTGNFTPSEKRIGDHALPRPPEDPRGKAFVCPHCFLILGPEVRKPERWK